MKLAIISGTSISRSSVFENSGAESVNTPYGEVEYKRENGVLIVNRHGFRNPLPPHKTNYRAYVSALKELEVEAVCSLNSVGSLQETLVPGTLVSCGDYVSFAPMTFIDEKPSGFAPCVDNALLPELQRLAQRPLEPDKVYAQTRGPRFETKAEVRILKVLGCDVVGMTFANEADLLLESGISVTSLCMVDNFAHGLVDEGLSMESFHEAVKTNQSIIDELLKAIVTRFGK